MPQPTPASDSISFKVSSAHLKAQFSDEQRGDSASADLAAPVTKYRGADSDSGARIAEPELDKPGNLRPRWRRVFVMASILLLVILLIFLIRILGTHEDWWAL